MQIFLSINSEVSDGSERLIPSLLYGAGMGVLILNISIAVITDAYNDAKTYDSRAFTRNQLAFASGSQSTLLVMLFQFFFTGKIMMKLNKMKVNQELKEFHLY
jgi:hypothetical protein